MAYTALLVLLGAYLVVVRSYHAADSLWLLRDQIRDWRLALGPLASLPLTGPQSTAGGYSLGPVYYWVLWLSRHIIGPWVSNLPHAGVYGIATLQTAGDLLLLHALRRLTGSAVVALAAVLLAATASMDLAISSTIWNPAVSVAFVKIALAFRLLRPGDAPTPWMMGTTMAAWFAVQAHSAAVFAAAPIVASYVATDLVAARVGAALQRVRAVVEVILVLQLPFLYYLFTATSEAAPTRFLAGSSQAVREGRLRLVESARATFSQVGYIIADPVPWQPLAVILLVAVALCLWRYRRDVAVLTTTLGPLACSCLGFSLWQGTYDGYWYLPLVPCAAVTLALGLTAVRPREVSAVLLALLVIAQPFRLNLASGRLKMPEYGPLTRGSRQVFSHARTVRRLDTTFRLPALSDAGFPYEAMGGHRSEDAEFDAVIDAHGNARFIPVQR